MFNKTKQTEKQASPIQSVKVVKNQLLVTLSFDITPIQTGDFSNCSIGMVEKEGVKVPNTYQICKQQLAKNIAGFEGLSMGVYLSQNIEKVSAVAKRQEKIAKLKSLGMSDDEIAEMLG